MTDSRGERVQGSTTASGQDTPPRDGQVNGGAADRDTAGDVVISPEAKADIRILIVDDEETLRESCASVLRHEGFSVSVCSRGEDARALLGRSAFDIVLLDLYMSQVSGLDLLKETLEANPETLAIIITGNPSVESSIEALRAGAWDYLPKPFPASQLQILIGRAAHTVVIGRETRALEAELEEHHGHSSTLTILGASPAFQRVIELARKVARTDASVFITGESGTGKEMIAQFIHQHSRRSSRPLVPINCAALPEPLLESEMFGHYQGAFTGAIRDKPGLLEAANGGTLLLDELGEMAPSVQAKLLRVIQDGIVRRLGSTKTDAVVNVRFMAAMNRDPREATEDGSLRQDLYYRLRVVPIHVPPIRERPEDVEIIAKHFLMRYWKQHRRSGSKPPRLTDEAVRALQSRSWPGNVRELENVMEHAVVLLDPGSDVKPEDLPSVDGSGQHAPAVMTNGQFTNERYHDARDNLIADFEKRYLVWLVRRAGGNMSKAARIAGVDRTTLYRLMEKHEFDRETLAP